MHHAFLRDDRPFPARRCEEILRETLALGVRERPADEPFRGDAAGIERPTRFLLLAHSLCNPPGENPERHGYRHNEQKNVLFHGLHLSVRICDLSRGTGAGGPFPGESLSDSGILVQYLSVDCRRRRFRKWVGRHRSKGVTIGELGRFWARGRQGSKFAFAFFYRFFPNDHYSGV